jgi:hypothetical protein
MHETRSNLGALVYSAAPPAVALLITRRGCHLRPCELVLPSSGFSDAIFYADALAIRTDKVQSTR